MQIAWEKFDGKKSTSSYAFNLESKLISLVSKIQASVSFSLTKEKYKAVVKNSCETLCLRKILNDLNPTTEAANNLKV